MGISLYYFCNMSYIWSDFKLKFLKIKTLNLKPQVIRCVLDNTTISGAPFKFPPQDFYSKAMLPRTVENVIAVCLKLKFLYYTATPEH